MGVPLMVFVCIFDVGEKIIDQFLHRPMNLLSAFEMLQ